MRMVGWVVLAVLAGAVAGFVAALLRPRDPTDYGSPYVPPAPPAAGVK